MSQEDSDKLYGILFAVVTEHFPDTPMGQRTDSVMALYESVRRWSTGEEQPDSTKVDMLRIDADNGPVFTADQLTQ